MADRMMNALALFVQDHRTNVTLSLHTRYGLTFPQASVVARLFGEFVAKKQGQQDGDLVVLHTYLCVWRAVGELLVVGVCDVGAHPHPTLHMVRQAVAVVKGLHKSDKGGGVTAAGLMKRVSNGDLFACLQEVLHQAQVGVFSVPPEPQLVIFGKAYAGQSPYLCLDPSVSGDPGAGGAAGGVGGGGGSGASEAENMPYLRASIEADKLISVRTKMCNFSMSFAGDGGGAQQPQAGGGEEAAYRGFSLAGLLPSSEQQSASAAAPGVSPRRAAAAPSPSPASPDVFAFMRTPVKAAQAAAKEETTPPRDSSGLDALFGGSSGVRVPASADATATTTPPPQQQQLQSTKSSVLDDLFGGLSPALAARRAGSASPAPVSPSLHPAPDLQLSLMVQECVSGRYVNGEGEDWSVLADVLLMGRGRAVGGLAELTEKEQAAVPEGHKVLVETLYLKLEGPCTTSDDVRPNPTFAQLVDNVRLIYRVTVRQVAPVSASAKAEAHARPAPVCVLKYREAANPLAAGVFPLKARIAWTTMSHKGQADPLLEQVNLQWVANPNVTLTGLSFCVDGSSEVYAPAKQQSKPEGVWDEAKKTLVWSCVENGAAVAPAKLQARVQMHTVPGCLDPTVAQHAQSRRPTRVRFDGSGCVGHVSVTAHPTAECGTAASLRGGAKTKFVSGSSFFVL